MYTPPDRPLSPEERKAENQRYIDAYAQAFAEASPAERELAAMEMSDSPTNWTRRRQLEQLVKNEAEERETRNCLKLVAALPLRPTANTANAAALAIAVRVARAAIAKEAA